MAKKGEKRPGVGNPNPGARNPNGNPLILQYTQRNKFGAGNDPKAARAKQTAMGREPYSIRNSIRHLVKMGIPMGKMKWEDFLAHFQKTDGDPMTVAELIAVRKLHVAIVNGDVKAMQQLEDSVDGKLLEVRAEAKMSLADLIAASYKPEVIEHDS